MAPSSVMIVDTHVDIADAHAPGVACAAIDRVCSPWVCGVRDPGEREVETQGLEQTSQLVHRASEGVLRRRDVGVPCVASAAAGHIAGSLLHHRRHPCGEALAAASRRHGILVDVEEDVYARLGERVHRGFKIRLPTRIEDPGLVGHRRLHQHAEPNHRHDHAPIARSVLHLGCSRGDASRISCDDTLLGKVRLRLQHIVCTKRHHARAIAAAYERAVDDHEAGWRSPGPGARRK
mmetsp:Transcript_88105/g.254283  ORF Transcript_88105/g.254283 Transcript_88105/m.254283 type:complete len:235 (+) Transcript_88105:891-1595(+)